MRPPKGVEPSPSGLTHLTLVSPYLIVLLAARSHRTNFHNDSLRGRCPRSLKNQIDPMAFNQPELSSPLLFTGPAAPALSPGHPHVLLRHNTTSTAS